MVNIIKEDFPFIFKNHIINNIYVTEENLKSIFVGNKSNLRIHYIYKINFANGKCYIGQSVDPCDRWIDHKYAASKYLKVKSKELVADQALAKHGVSNSTFEVILECYGIDSVNDAEKECIKIYNSHISQNGYNISWGGFNSKSTNETRAKISKARIGMKFSDQHKANMSKAVTGTKHSEETKQKISKANSGRKMTELQLLELRSRTMSESAKAKIALTKQGEKNHRAKLKWNDVNTMRKEFSESNFVDRNEKELFYNRIAIKYLVTSACIKLIIENKRWII